VATALGHSEAYSGASVRALTRMLAMPLTRAARVTPGLVLAGAVTALALPSALLAFSSRLEVALPEGITNHTLSGFTKGALDPGLARALAALPSNLNSGGSSLFRFTPAGFSARPDRSVTVAVRVDAETVHAVSAIIVRAPRAGAHAPAVPLRLAANSYSFGLIHTNLGNSALSPTMPNYVLPGDAHSKSDMPDLRGYSLTDGSASGQPSRLAPHIVLGEHDRAGRAPRTMESSGEQTVDLGGSYHLSRNVDVTAGVRYSDDRDRLQPLPDGKQQTQAVFVGTQFHF